MAGSFFPRKEPGLPSPPRSVMCFRLGQGHTFVTSPFPPLVTRFHPPLFLPPPPLFPLLRISPSLLPHRICVNCKTLLFSPFHARGRRLFFLPVLVGAFVFFFFFPAFMPPPPHTFFFSGEGIFFSLLWVSRRHRRGLFFTPFFVDKGVFLVFFLLLFQPFPFFFAESSTSQLRPTIRRNPPPFPLVTNSRLFFPLFQPGSRFFSPFHSDEPVPLSPRPR